MRARRLGWLAFTTLACHAIATPEEQADKSAAPGPAPQAAEAAAAAPAAPAAGQMARNAPGRRDGVSADELTASRAPVQWAADATTPAMVIRTGTAAIRIDSLEPAIVRVRSLAQRVGGYVANTTVQAGSTQYRQASLEVQVPAARFDDLVAELGSLGKVESVNVRAEDVGEEFVDISARVTNSRRLEERLIDLLATRTGRLQDVLAVERELARVREEIERYQGRLRFLKSRAAMSALTISVHEPLPLVDHPGRNVIVEAFKAAWRNFVGLIAGIISSLGIVVPILVAAGSAVAGIRRLRRPRPA
jgi:hypothetical protein